jgi:hypothetical protein
MNEPYWFLRSSEAALALSMRLAGVGILVGGLELLSFRSILRDEGLMSWEIGSLRAKSLCSGISGRFWDAWLRYPVFIWTVVLRVIVSAIIIVSPDRTLLYTATSWMVWWLLFLFTKRNHYGQDGADQMLLIIFFATAVSRLHHAVWATELALWMCAIQCMLAYSVAGVAKLSALGWRNGEFLPAVLGTKLYGTSWAAGYLRKSPRTALAMSWAVMLWEISFPLVFLLPWPWGVPILALGLCFHVANAWLMGLGSFLIAFTAAYPAVLFCMSHKGW